MNAHHSTLVYGLSGAGKSSFLEMFLRQLLNNYEPECKARLVTAEHYGAYSAAISEGLLDVWRFNNRPFPFEVSRRAAQGYWPTDVNDPTSPLVAPTPDTWKKYPIRIFEGIGTTAAYITSNHIEGGLLERAGKGDIIGPVQEHIQFMDGQEGIGGMCWTHFRIGQSEMLGLVQSSQTHPGYVIWTSHEDDGKDRGQPFVGPEVIGSKLTGVIGKEFDDMWHVVGVPVDVPTEAGEIRRLIERRLYLKEHIYPGGQIPCKAKNSAALGQQKNVPDYVTLSKNGLPIVEAPEKLLNYLEPKR